MAPVTVHAGEPPGRRPAVSIPGARESRLVAELEHPARTVTLEELSAIWFHQIVEVEIVKPVSLDPPMLVLNRIRGALGAAMTAGASREALAGRPCAFDPPCALDVFFREQIRIQGRHGLPKPWVPSLVVGRNTVLVRLTLFGLACDWLPALRERLIEGLGRVEWRTGSAPQAAEIRRADLLTAAPIVLPEVPDEAALVFDTPFDATGMDVRMEPSTIVARLARRIDGLARWMGASLATDWSDRAACWERCSYAFDDCELTAATRSSRRQGRGYVNPVVAGRIVIGGNLQPIWPLLVLGQTCHVGRGAVSGFGRYRLEPVAAAFAG